MVPDKGGINTRETSQRSNEHVGVTIAIPTYGRDDVLVDTLRYVLALVPPADEVLVLDQTPMHEPTTERQLHEWHTSDAIVWIRLAQPSIPHAMNEALLRASHSIVLFLDDDVIPASALVARHRAVLVARSADASVGQILQPGERPAPFGSPRPGDRMADLDFAFNGSVECEVSNVMAGNLAVRRAIAMDVGGFDENFDTTAYRFETDFAWRLLDGGGVIRFEPSATVDHLRAGRGGIRSWGSHLTSASPAHSTGDYYFSLMNMTPRERFSYVARRFRRTVLSRFDLTHPWWIPVKLIREIRALLRARQLARAGRRLLLKR